jgi:hypothetical protein
VDEDRVLRRGERVPRRAVAVDVGDGCLTDWTILAADDREAVRTTIFAQWPVEARIV